jgi:superfamily I DNA/RNA helicase
VREMKQYTVRGLSKETEKKIAKEAREKGISLNRAIVALLDKETGTSKKRERKDTLNDLDHLFGFWTTADTGEFERNLELQREVDEDLWKKRG